MFLENLKLKKISDHFVLLIHYDLMYDNIYLIRLILILISRLNSLSLHFMFDFNSELLSIITRKKDNKIMFIIIRKKLEKHK